MPTFTPHQDSALKADADWLKAPKGPLLAADPGATGKYAVETAEYNLGDEALLSGVHQLAWRPTTKVLKPILEWCGFPYVRVVWQVKQSPGAPRRSEVPGSGPTVPRSGSWSNQPVR